MKSQTREIEWRDFSVSKCRRGSGNGKNQKGERGPPSARGGIVGVSWVLGFRDNGANGPETKLLLGSKRRKERKNKLPMDI